MVEGPQSRLALPEPSPASIGLMGWVVLSTARFLISLLYRAVTFASALPAFLYRLLSLSLTVTINFSTLAFISVACVSTVSYLIRYRYQAYGRPHLQTARKENRVEVPDPHDANSKPGLSNYLDEFLNGIKIFGYLDRYLLLLFLPFSSHSI
jgi:lysophospholipid hydrolase